jgi:hypothetical protein
LMPQIIPITTNTIKANFRILRNVRCMVKGYRRIFIRITLSQSSSVY